MLVKHSDLVSDVIMRARCRLVALTHANKYEAVLTRAQRSKVPSFALVEAAAHFAGSIKLVGASPTRIPGPRRMVRRITVKITAAGPAHALTANHACTHRQKQLIDYLLTVPLVSNAHVMMPDSGAIG